MMRTSLITAVLSVFVSMILPALAARHSKKDVTTVHDSQRNVMTTQATEDVSDANVKAANISGVDHMGAVNHILQTENVFASESVVDDHEHESHRRRRQHRGTMHAFQGETKTASEAQGTGEAPLGRLSFSMLAPKSNAFMPKPLPQPQRPFFLPKIPSMPRPPLPFAAPAPLLNPENEGVPFGKHLKLDTELMKDELVSVNLKLLEIFLASNWTKSSEANVPDDAKAYWEAIQAALKSLQEVQQEYADAKGLLHSQNVELATAREVLLAQAEVAQEGNDESMVVLPEPLVKLNPLALNESSGAEIATSDQWKEFFLNVDLTRTHILQLEASVEMSSRSALAIEKQVSAGWHYVHKELAQAGLIASPAADWQPWYKSQTLSNVFQLAPMAQLAAAKDAVQTVLAMQFELAETKELLSSRTFELESAKGVLMRAKDNEEEFLAAQEGVYTGKDHRKYFQFIHDGGEQTVKRLEVLVPHLSYKIQEKEKRMQNALEKAKVQVAQANKLIFETFGFEGAPMA